MFCKKCGRKLNDGARFCPGCGTQIIVKQSSQAVSSAGHVCLACCAPLRKGVAFCMKCGTKVKAEVSPVCTACGAPLRDGAEFCIKCGAPAIAGAAAPTVTIPIPPEAAPEDITVYVSDTPPVSAPPRREKRGAAGGAAGGTNSKAGGKKGSRRRNQADTGLGSTCGGNGGRNAHPDVGRAEKLPNNSD